MLGRSRSVRRIRVCVSTQLWSASLRMPFGLGKCVQSGIGFYMCECDRVRGFCIEEKGLKDWSESSKGVYCYGD